MTIIYDLSKIRQNNHGNDAPRPRLPIDGYSKGFALMLSDGKHDGICFAGYETKEDAIIQANKNPIPDGWHLYLLSANGRDQNLQVRWAMYGEFIQ